MLEDLFDFCFQGALSLGGWYVYMVTGKGLYFVSLGEVLQKKKILPEFLWIEFEWRACQGTIGAFEGICH